MSTDKTACGEGNIGLTGGDLVTTHTGLTGGDLLATLGVLFVCFSFTCIHNTFCFLIHIGLKVPPRLKREDDLKGTILQLLVYQPRKQEMMRS